MITRAQIARQKLKTSPPPDRRALRGDLTRPHLRRFFECKDIVDPDAGEKPGLPWLSPKHGMKVENDKVKQGRKR